MKRVLVDLVAIGAALLTAFLLRFHFELFEVVESSPLTVRSHVAAAALWMLALFAATASNRLYDEDTLVEGGGETARQLRSLLEAAAIFAVFVFLTQSFYVSRSWFGLTLALSFAWMTVGRFLYRRYLIRQRSGGRMRRDVILVSRDGSPSDDDFFRELPEFEVINRMDLEALGHYLARERGSEQSKQPSPALLVKAADFDQEELWTLLVEAGSKGHPVFLHAAMRSVRRDRLTVRELGGRTIVKIAPPRLFGINASVKRAFDVVVASFLAVVALPMMVIAALAVVITSGRPVFYVQERVGANGRLFKMIKFRTMKVDAEHGSGPVWAERDDPRATPVGGFLRRWGIDELPQLLNVLRGDMSLVGPRPERPTFVQGFTEKHHWYRFRDRIRPGLTGWAQARGLRGDTPIDPRIDSDNWYIEHWSLSLDLKILVLTVWELIRGTSPR